NRLSPGDDFNARAEWADILTPHGWECVRQSGGKHFWRRPGKEGVGWSATTGLRSKAGNPLLCGVFSHAHPFPGPPAGRPCSTHSKFSAFALLNHAGDYSAAARDLAQRGYGTKDERQGEPNDQAPQEGPAGLATTCLATVRPVPVRWLVPGY